MYGILWVAGNMKIQKWSDQVENCVNRLCCRVFRLCYSSFPRGRKPLVHIAKINSIWYDWGENGVNRSCFICASGWFFFSIVLLPHLAQWAKTTSDVSGWSDWYENSFNHLWFVYSGLFCQFYLLRYSPSQPWRLKPSPIQYSENSKWSDCSKNSVNRLCWPWWAAHSQDFG